MANGIKKTLRLPVHEDDFFNFRRWLKARDPSAQLRYELIEEGLWLLTVSTAKRYLADAAARRWQAR